MTAIREASSLGTAVSSYCTAVSSFIGPIRSIWRGISSTIRPLGEISLIRPKGKTPTVAQQYFQATKTYYIAQIDNKPNTNAWATRALVLLMYAGIVAGIIGIGALLPHLGIDPKFGIEGISKARSLYLISAGGVSALAWSGLYAASRIKPKGTLDDYYKAFQRKRSDWFLDSNLNDFIGGLAFSLLAVTLLVHISPHLASILGTTQGCLNYPFGALLLLSGSYQLFESIKELNNARQIGDKEKIAKQLVNIFNSFLVLGLGVTALFGMMNNPYAIGVNLFNGLISFGLAGYIFYKGSYKTLKELNAIDENNAQAILEHLNKTLKLSDNEIDDLKTILSNKYNTKKSIEEWISQNSKYFDKTKKDQWDKIKTELEQIEENELNETKVEEIQQLIIRIEIEKTIESKLDDFRALVDEKTFKDTLNFIDGTNKTTNAITLFKSIKSQIKTKIYFEILKMIMYAGFAVISATTLYTQFTGVSVMNNSTYDISNAALCFLSFLVGLVPRFRNIPPSLEKQPFDINEQFEKKEYLNTIKSNLDNIVKSPKIHRSFIGRYFPSSF